MSNFDAFNYLYFNPELTAYSGIVTVEQAQGYYTLNSNLHLAAAATVVPTTFDPEIFINSSRDLANVSSLSKDIALAMSNQGLSSTQISKKQRYIANIYQDVVYTGSNTFTLSMSNMLGSNNLLAGDAIKVIDNNSTELFFTVSSVSGSGFTVSNGGGLTQARTYLLFGINVTDFERIARVNYARIISGYSNLNSSNAVVSSVSSSNTNFISSVTDSNFNASLYKILYPETRSLTDVQSYLDWINKRKNEIYRIVNVDDIAAGSGNRYVNINFLNISSNIVFRDSMVDGISTFLDPALCNVSGDSNKLITENAIKFYTDFRLSNLQNLGSFTNMLVNDEIVVNSQGTFSNNVNVFGNLYVNSNSSFSNNVAIQSNLDVTGASVFRNSMMLAGGGANATFSNCVLVNGSMSVTGNLYNARIGLGYMGSFLTSNNGSNVVQAQNYNDTSDRRIKNNVESLSPEECLDRVCRLDVATFSYLYGHSHTDAKGTTGVIAQQLEKEGLAEYVYLTSGFLPEVMKEGTIDGDYLYADADLQVGRLTKLVMAGEDVIVRVMRKLERGVFQVSPSVIGGGGHCLVYGYHTDSLRNVDYKQLFVLALGAIKCLAGARGTVSS